MAYQSFGQVRAVIAYQEALQEAGLSSHNVVLRDLFHSPLDEEVFLSQLHSRAKVLNAEFQVHVLDTAAAHAVNVSSNMRSASTWTMVSGSQHTASSLVYMNASMLIRSNSNSSNKT